MRAITIISPRPDLLLEFRGSILNTFNKINISDGIDKNDKGFVVNLNKKERAYFDEAEYCDENLYEEDLLSLIQKKFSTSYLYTIHFNSLSFLKRILMSIADTDDFLIDDDFGNIISGKEFVKKIKKDPNWDWREVDPGWGRV